MLAFIIILALIIFSLVPMAVAFKNAYTVPKARKTATALDIVRAIKDEELKQKILPLAEEASKLPYEDVYIKNREGMLLHAAYYSCGNEKAPCEIMFHGYKSVALRDFCGGLPLALKRGHNVLLVDQRAHGKSEGKFLTFGIKERFDCLDWINYVIYKYGDVKIFLVGMSMGAATVLMTLDLGLPKNVIGIIADCGYSSPYGIIKKVEKDRNDPVAIGMFLIRTSGILFGGFDILSASPEESVKSANVPVIFIHGGEDKYVPIEMGIKNYEACASEKEFFKVEGAGHGLSYIFDREGYENKTNEFCESCENN